MLRRGMVIGDRTTVRYLSHSTALFNQLGGATNVHWTVESPHGVGQAERENSRPQGTVSRPAVVRQFCH
jgi:hypothetical protein